MKRIEIKENNLNMVYEITDENEIKLLHFSNLPFDENDINSCEGTASFRPVVRDILFTVSYHADDFAHNPSGFQ